MATLSFWSSLGRLLQPHASQPSSASELSEADKLMEHVKGIINRQDLVVDRLEKYQQARKLPFDQRETAYIPIYLSLEQFIVTNKPLVVKSEYTKATLRQEIHTTFVLDHINKLFRLIFLPDQTQALLLFEIGVNDLAQYLLTHMGVAHVQEITAKSTKGTFLESVNVSQTGVDFNSIYARTPSTELVDLINSSRALYAALYREIRDSLGIKTAENITVNSFQFIKIHYDYDLISRYLEVVPDGVLEDERLSFLSRTELAKKIRSRTQELEEEKSRLQAAVESMPLGFIITDSHDNTLTMNTIAKKICSSSDPLNPDQSPPDYQSYTIKDILHFLSLGSFDLLAQCQKSRLTNTSIEFKDISIGKKFLHVFISPIVMTKDQPEIIGTVVLIEDITEAKLLERSREEFFSIASHELRTPLTAIRGYTSLIQQFYKDKIQDPQLMAMVTNVNESSTRLIDIVNDFLDVSRIEQGKITFKHEQFNLLDIVREALHDLQSLVQEKKLYLKINDPPHQLSLVLADKDRTKQVLLNLIGNALKFTESGGVTIEISEKNNSLYTAVTDTGKGIPPQNQNLLFRKFQQAGDNILRRDATHGTGLGLYISKLMVELMGGTIYLRNSEINQGSTFVFSLPVAGSDQNFTSPPNKLSSI